MTARIHQLKVEQQSENPEAAALVFSYTQAAQSESTRRSYALDIRHFKANGGKIPATATMVAEYLAAFAGTLAVASLQHRLIAIHKAHTDKGLPSPVSDHLVKRTMQGIRRTFGVAQRRVKAIDKDDLLEMMVLIDRQKPTKAARDRALLLVGLQPWQIRKQTGHKSDLTLAKYIRPVAKRKIPSLL